MKKSIKIIVLMLILSLSFGTITLLSACNNKADDTFQIAGFTFNFSDPQQNAVKNAIEEQVAKMDGTEIKYYDAAGSQATQNDQIDNEINKGADLLIVGLVDKASAQTICNKAKQADVYIIFYNIEPEDAVIDSYEKCTFVGTSPAEGGIKQGYIIGKYFEGANYDKYDLNGDGFINYTMIRADLAHPEANGRTEFSVKVGNEELKKVDATHGLKRIGNEDLLADDWSSVKGKDTMSLQLTSTPMGGDVYPELVICNNDGIAVGAVQALVEKGWNLPKTNANYDPDKFIPVVGVDAIAQARTMITDGQMLASVAQPPEKMAEYILTIANNIVKGNEYLADSGFEFKEGSKKLLMPYDIYPEGYLD